MSTDEISISYTFNGDSVGTITRSTTDFEDDLSYIALSSDDFRTFWDDITVRKETVDDQGVQIQTIDPGEYPLVCTYLQIDTVAGRDNDIGEGDIAIEENGTQRSIDTIQPLGGGDSEIDIAFVFDDTGSMDDEIAAMKNNVQEFADDIETAGFDARYALVSFKDDVEVDQSFTASLSEFQNAVNDLEADAGDDVPEDNFDAIEEALELEYRAGAQQVVIDITDAIAHYDGDDSGYTDWTLPEMADRILSEGVTYIAVAPSEEDIGDEQTSKQVLAEETTGLWYDIRAIDDFSVILDEIEVELTTGRYLICFETPLPCTDDPRTVTITVDDPDQGEIQETGDYLPPVTCRDGGDDISQFDRNENDEIDFQEVKDAISHYNTGEPLNGKQVEFGEVIEVIEAYNTGTL